jgi:N-acetyltransferase
MIHPKSVVLERDGLRLEPMTEAHGDEIVRAASDGNLWELGYTSVPGAEGIQGYLKYALDGQRDGHMLPWVIRELASGDVIGSTRYHDIMASIDRAEIGYTFYAKRFWRSRVNTTCKLMLLTHGFEELGCRMMGLRTDILNLRSQRAIEALGAKKDGVIRHFGVRKDGSVRDTVMYSILLSEWPEVRARLEKRLLDGGFGAAAATSG